MKLEKYSFGIGDRFSHQGKAQLAALIKAKDESVDIVPVWNKSHREHTTIGTGPDDVRREADQAVKDLNWPDVYYVDADHINLDNVDLFVECSNFFTLDVAKFIAAEPEDADLANFIKQNSRYVGALEMPGIDEKFEITPDTVEQIGRKFLAAVKEAGRIYRHIEKKKGSDAFITEVSIDESDQAQSPVELFFILSAVAQQAIPAQTIAPKFTGRFNKGVDYVGDPIQFEKEFNQDIAVINHAIKEFSLPSNLKLSIHSGSDKFSIYPPINKALKKFDAGLHLKTAGTTWLEELIGLAQAQGPGLELAKEIYKKALDHFDELCAPYAAVIDIDKTQLPAPDEVDKWDGQTFAATLRHDQSCEKYNLHFRQLLHVGYKIAAKIGARYYDAIEKYEDIISKNVTENIYDRHIKRLFKPSFLT